MEGARGLADQAMDIGEVDGMRIIDAHLHFCPQDGYFTQLARAAGHENQADHLKGEYGRLGIACGIVMGNRGIDPGLHRYPEFMRYCIGVESQSLSSHAIADSLDQVEENLRRSQCVGIKLYPGYNPAYITDGRYEPIYELARAYQKPVAVHTGETVGPRAYLKYSHPLTLDEAAVKHPHVQFVMCHFGNPWLMDAAAVLDKNDNVAADLSGLLESRVDLDGLFVEKAGYLSMLSAWMGYLHEYDNLMFGTDWPLANLEEYIGFIRRLVPEKYHEKVFFDNANRIYRLGLTR